MATDTWVMKRFADNFAIAIIFGEISTSLNIVILEQVKRLPPPAKQRVREMDKDGDGRVCFVARVCAYFL